ncbi:MAG: ferredoxin family protein [Chloroflexi bacterium]|nr:ferredoxin family protein [Chloroflexota bacterium]
MRASMWNTLEYDAQWCIGCGLCSDVCPHGVFGQDGGIAILLRPDDCMECGACQLNCPTGAIKVDSGVGCAAAMIYAALQGRRKQRQGATACCAPAQASCCESSQPSCCDNKRCC